MSSEYSSRNRRARVALEPVVTCPRCGIHVAENADGEYWCHGCHKDFTDQAERFRAKCVKKNRDPWPDPRIPDESYGSVENLYGYVKSFYMDHLDLMDAREHDVLTCWTLGSCRQEDFQTAPYVFFLGPPNSGKTRALECLWQLCHRGMLVSSISASALFRSIDLWHPTLLIDETEVYTSEEKAEIRSILNSGYRRGQKVVRSVKVGKAEGAYEIGQFDTFGFKALAGTSEMRDTLRSRCITIRMQRANRKVNVRLDMERAAKMRGMLQHYALQHNGANLTAEDLAEKIPDPRVVELFLPLITVAPSEAIRDTLTEYAKEIAENRTEDETTSLEARVLEAALAVCDSKIEEGKVAVRDIAERLNEGLEPKERFRSDRVGRILAKMGFHGTRIGHGAVRGIKWTPGLVERLKRRYAPYLQNGGRSSQVPADTTQEASAPSAVSATSFEPVLRMAENTTSEQKATQDEMIQSEARNADAADASSETCPRPDEPSAGSGGSELRENRQSSVRSSDDAATAAQVFEESDGGNRHRILAKLLAIRGPFSWDYATSQAMKITGDRSKAEQHLKQLQAEGQLVQDPESYWRLTR